jgi:hypothetical protein
MHDVVKRPAKGWQIYFVPHQTGTRINAIYTGGISRKAPRLPKGAVAQENIEFTARIKYSYACRGSSCALITFEDTEPGKPYVYFMSTEELGELFRGIATGQIKVGPGGIDVRLTFVKKGSAVFTRPVLI